MSEELEKAWDVVVRLRNDIALAKEELVDAEHHLGELMGSTTAHLGNVILHRSKTAKREWDDENLFEAVMDASWFDPTTGEKVEETPVQRIVQVYGSVPRGEKDGRKRLPGRNASLTELKKRNVKPELFCETTWADTWHVVAK